MKKAYYVYSIFEKLNLTAGFKALAVLLMFSISFLGFSSEATAQNEVTPGFANVDQSFLKGFEFNEDKDHAMTIVKEQYALLAAIQPPGGVEEVVHGSKLHFLKSLGTQIRNTQTVMSAMSSAHVSLSNYVDKYGAWLQPHIDVEDIVTDYAKLLQ